MMFEALAKFRRRSEMSAKILFVESFRKDALERTCILLPERLLKALRSSNLL